MEHAKCSYILNEIRYNLKHAKLFKESNYYAINMFTFMFQIYMPCYCYKNLMFMCIVITFSISSGKIKYEARQNNRHMNCIAIKRWCFQTLRLYHIKIHINSCLFFYEKHNKKSNGNSITIRKLSYLFLNWLLQQLMHFIQHQLFLYLLR